MVDSGASLSPSGAGNLTYSSSDEGVVKVVDGKLVAVGVGSAVVNVSFAGDYKYLPAQNKTISVNVSKIPTVISVVNSSLALKVDDVVDSAAGLSPSGVGNLTYSSSDVGVVKVVDGKLVAVGVGSAVVNVSFAGDYKYLPAQNKTISVSVSLINASVGADDLKIYVDGVAEINPVTLPGGLDLLYSIADKNIADVDASGKVIGIKEGTTSITITINGKGKYFENSTRIMVTVSKIPTVINVENKSVNLFVEDSLNTGAALNPQEAGNLTYTSSDENVAIVKDGKIIALKEGEAIITVSFAGNNKYAGTENKTINVTVKLKNTSVSVNNETLELFVGDNFTIVATTVPQGLKVKFDTGDDDIIKLDDLGHVTALARGNATISVSVGDNVVYKYTVVYVNVTVNEKPVPKENLTMHANAEPITVGEDANVIVTGLKDATGDVSLIVNGKTYTSPIRNGEATVIVSGLKEDAAGQVLYPGDDNYNNASASVVIVVNPLPVPGKKNLTIKASSDPITVGENATIIVTGLEGATGVVSVAVDGKIFTAPIRNGEASVIVSGMTENVTAYVGYVGDKNYNPDSVSVKITVYPAPKPERKNLTLHANVEPITVGEDATVKVTGFESATGDVSLIVNGRTYTSPIRNGEATVIVSGLKENSVGQVLYLGDDNYNNASASVVIVVNPLPDPEKKNLTIKSDADPITVGENATVIVTGLENASGVVSVIVDGKIFTAPIRNGESTVTVSGITENVTAYVDYAGDDNYNPASASVKITVKPKENATICIGAPDVNKYFKGSERFVVTVTDYKGNPLANKSVAIVINGVKYERTTDANGTCSIALNLPANVYNVNTTVDNATTNSVVTILTTVNGNDLVKVFKNATQYYATFRNSEGKYLAEGSVVRFNINGVMYDRKVAANGLAKLNINLGQGKYIITAINPATGEMSSNNITVISKIIENSDLTKYYRNATQYAVKIIGDDGKAVGAGESVTFNINGVFYTRQTNASGIVKLNINLPPGDYIITAEYKNCRVSNNIKVLPVLTAKDLVKKYGTKDQFVATLVDGQGKPYPKQTVTFNINGVFYSRVTESSGQAKLNINLMAGEYIITSTYNGCNIANKITISG